MKEVNFDLLKDLAPVIRICIKSVLHSGQPKSEYSHTARVLEVEIKENASFIANLRKAGLVQ